MEELDRDFTLCECDLASLVDFVENQLEELYAVNMVRLPGICLTMVRAEDSVEKQEFYLGEALTTECEVEINGKTGLGLCLGDEPDRAYCLAVVDAIFKQETALPEVLTNFLEQQWKVVQAADQEEFNQILSTRVDFKLMDQF